MKGQAGPEKMKRERGIIVFLQYMLPISFTLAMAGIIAWIVGLLRLSAKLRDVPSASVGISIVAIPLFLLLLGIFWYVFLGIMRNQEDPREGDEDSRGHGSE